MAENNSYYDIKEKIKGEVKAGLCSILAASMLASGCATPTCIKQRRALGRAEALNNRPYTEVTASDRGVEVRAGIEVKFNNLEELRKGAASALTAFGYGIIRPFYREFWKSTDESKLEYSGLTPFTGDGYIRGRGAETAGEWTRYAAIIAGILASQGSGSGSSAKNSDNPPGQDNKPSSRRDNSDSGSGSGSGGGDVPPSGGGDL